MPRIRTIKPEFWTDEKLSLLDPTTRLVFLGLVSLADDAGRLLDNIKLLDGQLFPNTDDSCSDSLDTLARISRIVRYTSASGQNLIQIVGWDKHQKVDHPNKHVLPAPPVEAISQAKVRPAVAPPLAKSSRQSRENRASRSRKSRATTLDQGPRTKDHLSDAGASDSPPSPAPKPPDPRKADLDALWQAWVSTHGAIDYGRFRKALAPLYPASGEPAYRRETLVGAITLHGEWVTGLAPSAAKWETVERWAGDVVRWARLAEMPLVEPDGTPSERARMLLGAA